MRNDLRFEKQDLDRIDLGILVALAADARRTTASLARELGMSAPAVAERIKRLEESGVIVGYSAQIDPRALGLPLAVYLRVRPIPGKLKQVASLIVELDEIVSCDRVTGDDCFIAKAHVASVEDLERLIDQLIPYAMTNTSIIQSSPVQRSLPRIP